VNNPSTMALMSQEEVWRFLQDLGGGDNPLAGKKLEECTEREREDGIKRANRAWKGWALKGHPDKGGSGKEFVKMSERKALFEKAVTVWPTRESAAVERMLQRDIEEKRRQKKEEERIREEERTRKQKEEQEKQKQAVAAAAVNAHRPWCRAGSSRARLPAKRRE